MFLRLKRLYDAGRLTADGIAAAAARSWITAAQVQEILRAGETAA